MAGIPGQVLRRLEHQAGLAAGRLDDAVLDRYLPLGPVRRRGSRYCPSCLAERDGRWLLSWRLGWVFACTTHGVLLCDTCPACGQIPRGRAGRAGLNPPGSCANTIKRNNYCGADLRQVTPTRLAPGHPVLAAQHWTGALLTLDDTGPGGNGASPRNVLSDLGIVGLLGAAPGTSSPVRRLRPGGAGRLARVEPADICCPPPAGPGPACQRRADRRPGRHRHDRAHRERRAGHRTDPGAAAAPGGPAAAPARRPARPALAEAIRGGPRPVPARPGPRPRPRRPDPLPHRHAPGAHPGRPARAARRPRPGDPAAALAGLGDPADARPRVRGRPVPQHHRRVPAAARPPRPRHRHGHHRTARLPQRPGHRRGAAGPGRRRPRHGAHRDQLPGRLPGHQRQPHRLPAPPRPHPRRNHHHEPVARPVLRRGRAPRRSTPAPRRPALPVPAAHRRRPARPPARPRVHLRQRLQPLPDLRRNPPHRACGTRCTATPPGSCTTSASASR